MRVGKWVSVVVAGLFFFSWVVRGEAAGPRHIYLTWMSPNTSTTMTVNFHLSFGEDESFVYFDTKPRKGKQKAYRHHVKGLGIPMSFAKRSVHHAELTNLEPDTTYYFVAGSPKDGYSQEHKFHTIPTKLPLRFMAGGDMDVDNVVQDLLGQAASRNPHFAVLGGDLAYGNGRPYKWKKWDKWLSNWTDSMVTKQGLMIPLMVALGNHEIRGSIATEKSAPFYFSYFAQDPGRTFFYRTFGTDLIFFVLDSGFASPVGGTQSAWLEEQLRANDSRVIRLASYHIPLYPSYRSFDGGGSRAGRSHWGPIFDRFRLTTAFEHHDHTLKRTKRLRHNKIDQEGTLYLGDGALGMWPRRVRDRWYLAKAISKRHFWFAEVESKKITYQAIDENGEILDSYVLPLQAKGVSTPLP